MEILKYKNYSHSKYKETPLKLVGYITLGKYLHRNSSGLPKHLQCVFVDGGWTSVLLWGTLIWDGVVSWPPDKRQWLINLFSCCYPNNKPCNSTASESPTLSALIRGWKKF